MPNIEFIHQKVNQIINKYDTRNPFDICKHLDINIHYKDLGTSLKAYYFCQSRIKNIIINSRSSSIVQQILCAHELGHAILHGKLATMRGFQDIELFDLSSPTEYEANIFAAELIIADEDVIDLLNDCDKSFFTIAKELYVPAELLDFKFRVLKHKGMRIEIPCSSPSNFLKQDLL